MSSEIEAYMGREQAWYRLGTIKGRAFGRDDMEHDAPELLSAVTLQPTYVRVWDAMNQRYRYDETPEKGAVVRTYDHKIVGEGLGKDTYGTVQPLDAFEWGEAIAGLSGFPCISAGTIREGRQFFFTYDTGTVETAMGPIDGYLTVASSHDGTLALTALNSSIIVVCANTLAMAQASATDRITLKHTAKVEDRMEQALRALQANVNHTKDVVETVNQLASIQVREFRPLLDGILPVIDTAGRSKTMRDTARSSVLELLRSPVTEGAENTGWAFVQAVNTYENWNQTVRGMKGRDPQIVRAERQFDAIVKGAQPLTTAAVEAVLATV